VNVNGHKTWGLWLLGTLGTFAWFEHKAFRDRGEEKPSVTLTATMRCWMGVKPQGKRRFLAVPAFGAFVIYLGGHFIFGLWNA
jgi:hypothetical protein